MVRKRGKRDANPEGTTYSEQGSPKYPDSDVGYERENFTTRAVPKREPAKRIDGVRRTDAGPSGVVRYDRGELGKPEKLSNGWLRAEGVIAHAGLLTYRRDHGDSLPDVATGDTWVEYRPAAEHSDAALSTFRSVPLTNKHPPVGVLDATNTKMFQVGTVEAPRRDGDMVKANLLITDSDAIGALEKGRQELSCGYLCDLELEPGEYEGQHYDAVQRNVRGNHVALVDMARAGSIARVRMDGSFEQVVTFSEVSEVDRTMTKIRLDGVDFEASEQLAQMIAKILDGHKGEVAALVARADAAEKAAKDARADADKAQARADAAEKAAKDAPVAARALIEARLALESKARGVLGAEFKFDGKSNADVYRAVAEKAGHANLDGKSEDYLSALFDAAVAKGREDGVLGGALSTASVEGSSLRVDAGQTTDLEKQMIAFGDASRNAYRPRKQ